MPGVKQKEEEGGEQRKRRKRKRQDQKTYKRRMREIYREIQETSGDKNS